MCREERTFPRDEQLLRLAHGDPLRQLVGPLAALNTVWTAEREPGDRARLATSKGDEAKAALERLLNPPPPPLPAEEEGEEVTAEDSVGVKHIDQAGYTLDNLADGLQRQPPTTGDPPELDVEVLGLMGERLHRLARAAAGLKGMIAELPSGDEDSGLQESQ